MCRCDSRRMHYDGNTTETPSHTQRASESTVTSGNAIYTETWKSAKMSSRPIDQHSFWLLFLKSPFQTQTGFSSLLRSPAPWMSILTHCQRYLLMIRKWLFPPALSSELHTWTPEWPPGLLHWNVPPNSHFNIGHPSLTPHWPCSSSSGLRLSRWPRRPLS